MTRGAALVLFGLAICFVSSVGGRGAAAPVPKHLMKEPDHPDLVALQGKWELTGLAALGYVNPPEGVARLQMTAEFGGDVVAVTSAGERQRTTATARFDRNAKPRRMTFTGAKTTDLDGKPLDGPAMWWPHAVIYRFEGDTLVLAALAVRDPKKFGEFPTNFACDASSKSALLTFKLVRK